MASTRNINMPSDYCLQQRAFRLASGYELYPYKRLAPNTRLPCFGINVGGMPNTTLSCNATNTESFLYGIGSTNLVKPAKPFTAHLKCIPGIAFFQRPEAFLPEPLVMLPCQRPQGPFS